MADRRHDEGEAGVGGAPREQARDRPLDEGGGGAPGGAAGDGD